MHLLPDAPPTDPDVKISLIRFLGAGGFVPLRRPDRHDPVWRTTMLPAGTRSCLHHTLLRSQVTRFAVSVYLPWFPSSDRYARPHLPFSGSFGPHFPAFPVCKKNFFFFRPSVLCSAKTAASPSPGRSIFSVLPGYPALPVFCRLCLCFRRLISEAGLPQ